MHRLMTAPPHSTREPITDFLHGVPVTDPYRWLEDQESPRTRAWIEEQTRYAREYLDSLPGRERIRKRIREFLAVETYDSLTRVGNRYFFRKRLPDQEQPCIYMREGADGEDQLLNDPAERGAGKYTAIQPLRVSPDGTLLLYETKEGGERTGTFALLDIENRKTLPDILPRGHLFGFAFAPNGKSFYYVHQASDTKHPFYRAAYHHILGTPFSEDRKVFYAGEDQKISLGLFSDKTRLGFAVHKSFETLRMDFYLKLFESEGAPKLFLKDIDYEFGPYLLPDRILAITNRDAPNRRIVELRLKEEAEPEWIDVVSESDARIRSWFVVSDQIFVSYIREGRIQIFIFELSGQRTGEIAVGEGETVNLVGGSPYTKELLLVAESFAQPTAIFTYSVQTRDRKLWSKTAIPFDPANYSCCQVWYASKDDTRVPMFLVGKREVLEGSSNPTIMTSYGGFGVCMTPQFSVLVAFLMEHGCLFALPNIRGGSEFGNGWHNAAKRHNRQTAYDDFLGAAEWLIKTGRTTPEKLAIFGGSNSGLLVGAALTQRPDLFCAVLCMVPILDMLRYHLFDAGDTWKDEFGTADDPEDFATLVSYSPYHHVRHGGVYPATMITSGDADTNCNPLHARKMTARLQAANISSSPIFLDYKPFRGHSPVLPLSERVEGLTDRLSFLCVRLGIEL